MECVLQTAWIRTAWVETKKVKERKITSCDYTKENQNKEKKLQKVRTGKYTTLFRPEKTAVKRTANNAKRLSRN